MNTDSLKGEAAIKMQMQEEKREGSLLTTLQNFGKITLSYLILLFNAVRCMAGLGSKNENVAEMTEITSNEIPQSDVRDNVGAGIKGSEAPSSVTSSAKAPELAAAPEQSPGLALPEPGADQTKNTIVIKNLPFKYKQTDLDLLLQEHNAKPKNIRMMRDGSGRFTGIIFLRCQSKEEAGRLILSMNNLEIGGRQVQVDFKQKKKKNKLAGSGEGLTSSDSEWSQPNSLRSSAEYLREPMAPVPNGTEEPFREGAPRRSSLRMSAEHREFIPQEHLAFSSTPMGFPAPIPPPVTLLASLPPMVVDSPTGKMQPVVPPILYPRRSSLNGCQPLAPGQMCFNTHYFANAQYQYQAQHQQPGRTLPRKIDIRRSTQCVETESPVPPMVEGRRRSIASIEDPLLKNSVRGGFRPPLTVASTGATKPACSPIRQPIGPDGKTNGFSSDYQKSRTVA